MAGTLLLMQYSVAVIPEGMGTIGAKRCRHQLPQPCAALTVLPLIFQLLLPLASGSQPACLSAKEKPVSKAGLPAHELILFSPSLIPSPATAKTARQKKQGLTRQQLLSSPQSYHQLELFQNLGSADL